MFGSLMYLTSSRPDIMFVVCACARYQVNPKVLHLHAVKRIFRYLKGQLKLGLWYPKDSPFDLVGYTDNDYPGASLDRKSTTGGCQFLRCRLISWHSKKRTVVANSTTEAEYVAPSRCLEWKEKAAKDEIGVTHEEMGEGSKIPNDHHHTPITTQPSSSQPQRKQKSRKSKKKNTEVPQPSGSIDNVPDENVPTTSNDPLLSDEDRLKLTELMDLCSNLQKKVLDLEKAKTAQDSEIASLKKKVKNSRAQKIKEG
ncbi:hypothetical protein Tco_1492218 [Tanacetum coccineum]